MSIQAGLDRYGYYIAYESDIVLQKRAWLRRDLLYSFFFVQVNQDSKATGSIKVKK